MNRDILKVIIFIIVVFSLAFSYLNRCSIVPWQTVKFRSCPEQSELIQKDGFDALYAKYSDSTCNGTFMYTVSHGYNETMYCSSEPFEFVFVFYHYDPSIRIYVNSLSIKNEKEEQLPITMDFPFEVKTNYFENYKDLTLKEKVKSDYLSGSFETDYIYNIKRTKSIYIEMEVEVHNEDKVERKVLKQVLKKEVKRGIFQYAF